MTLVWGLSSAEISDSSASLKSSWPSSFFGGPPKMLGRVGLWDCSTRWDGTLVVRGYFYCYSGFISFAGEVVILEDYLVCLPIMFCFSIVFGYFSSS